MVKPFWFGKQFCICKYLYNYYVKPHLMIMVTMIRHLFINIFQTQHFSAIKFYLGYEKYMSFLVIPTSPKVWKKVEKIGLCPLSGQGLAYSRWWSRGVHVDPASGTYFPEQNLSRWWSTQIKPKYRKKNRKSDVRLKMKNIWNFAKSTFPQKILKPSQFNNISREVQGCTSTVF